MSVGRNCLGSLTSLTYPFFTIGHSTRSIEEFASLLQHSEIKYLVDVRTVPRSRTNPQFNLDVLGTTLQEYQIAYCHIAGLGGLRGKQRQFPHAEGRFWRNQSFQNYADYSQTPEFRAGLQQLIDLAETGQSAIMCAEAVWWRCHRRIIADYLIAGGEAVLHIMDQGRHDPAHLTPGAVIQPDRTILYPAADGAQAEMKLG